MTDDIPADAELAVDGLPRITPTQSRVDAVLEYTDRDPDESLGHMPPRHGAATVEKLATNAVIAGCRPEYFPVILAAVEGMLHDEFGLRGILSTTHPCWPVIMVNGPIADELEINYGVNTMGQGFRANSTIGRAISLIAMNVGGAVPGQSDDATYGGPHKKGVCFAENEKRNPWEPLHVERGHDGDTSAVTVFSAESPHNINDHVARDAATLLTTCAHTMAVLGTNVLYYEEGEPHLNLSPEHAELIADDGWSKMDVKRFIYDHARVPKYLFEGHGMAWEHDSVAKHHQVTSPHEGVGLAAKPEDVIVTVSGGQGRQSFFLPIGGDPASQTVPITRSDGTPISSVEAFRDD
jgi:hypothetical protein